MLGWESETDFDELVKEMVDFDLKMAKGEVENHEAPKFGMSHT